MAKSFTDEINRSLSSTDIINTVGNCNLMEYSGLSKYNKLTEVVDKDTPLILLYESKRGYGHWTCVIDHGDKIEVFDSYGCAPDTELLWTKRMTRIELGENVPFLTYLLLNDGRPVIYNNIKLQGEDTFTCGRWVCCRIILKDVDIDEFCSYFTNIAKKLGLTGGNTVSATASKKQQSLINYICDAYVTLLTMMFIAS